MLMVIALVSIILILYNNLIFNLSVTFNILASMEKDGGYKFKKGIG